jgi:hypothetical protein
MVFKVLLPVRKRAIRAQKPAFGQAGLKNYTIGLPNSAGRHRPSYLDFVE